MAKQGDLAAAFARYRANHTKHLANILAEAPAITGLLAIGTSGSDIGPGGGVMSALCPEAD